MEEEINKCLMDALRLRSEKAPSKEEMLAQKGQPYTYTKDLISEIII